MFKLTKNPQRVLTACALTTFLCLGVSRANAASVYMWVANGTGVTAYDSTGATVTLTGTAANGAALAHPTGQASWGNAFSVTTFGSSATNQFVVVSDALDHSLTEYSYTSTNNAVAQVGTSFAFTADPAGGAISPQEIAIDTSGNLWTTSAGGAVTEYCGSSGGCSIGGVSKAAGAVMQTVTIPTADGAPRGIMIDTHTVGTTQIYVTTSTYGATGAGVYQFTLGTIGANAGVAGAVSTFKALTVSTSGTQETGQLRGITYDSGGDIYFADSTWGATGTDQGYIDEGTALTQIATSLNGPNELEVAAGTAASGNDRAACDVIYAANYYAGTVTEISTGWTTGGSNGSTCGSGIAGGTTTTLISGLTTPTGIAISFSHSALGDSIGLGPQGLFTADQADAPEPGSWVLALSALLIGGAVKARRGVSARVRQS